MHRSRAWRTLFISQRGSAASVADALADIVGAGRRTRPERLLPKMLHAGAASEKPGIPIGLEGLELHATRRWSRGHRVRCRGRRHRGHDAGRSRSLHALANRAGAGCFETWRCESCPRPCSAATRAGASSPRSECTRWSIHPEGELRDGGGERRASADRQHGHSPRARSGARGAARTGSYWPNDPEMAGDHVRRAEAAGLQGDRDHARTRSSPAGAAGPQEA